MKQQTNLITAAEYQKMINSSVTKKRRQNHRKEGILQEQCHRRFDTYKMWNQLTIPAMFVHIPNERVFGSSIITFLQSKGAPLNFAQKKWLNFYLSGFAKNLAKAGLAKAFPDNMILANGKKAIFFELKVEKNKPSPEQNEIMNLLRSFGFPVYLLYTVDEFDNMLKTEGYIKEF